ncbi:hypothetical protein EBR96_05895, partial [bacterium]|nr:hypothetical protein [bacterium]
MDEVVGAAALKKQEKKSDFFLSLQTELIRFGIQLAKGLGGEVRLIFPLSENGLTQLRIGNQIVLIKDAGLDRIFHVIQRELVRFDEAVNQCGFSESDIKGLQARAKFREGTSDIIAANTEFEARFKKVTPPNLDFGKLILNQDVARELVDTA